MHDPHDGHPPDDHGTNEGSDPNMNGGIGDGAQGAQPARDGEQGSERQSRAARTSSARLGPLIEEPLEALPWDRPGAPFFSALFETLKVFITDPKGAFARVGLASGIARPLAYGVLVTTVSSVVALLIGLSIQLPFLMMILRDQQGGAEQVFDTVAFPVILLLFIVCLVIIIPLSAALSLLLQGGILHLTLTLLGAAEERFEATLRLVCYAATAQIANLVPLFGGYLAFPWLIVLQVLGVAEIHKCSYGKSTLAVLLPLILCCGLIVGLMFMIFAIAFGTAFSQG